MSKQGARTILSELRRAQPRPDGDALLVAPHEAAPERGPEVGLLHVAESRGEGEVERGVPAQLLGILDLVNAQRVGAVLDRRLVGLHQVHEGEAEKLLFTSVFGCSGE